jgi:hypothetical protein
MALARSRAKRSTMSAERASAGRDGRVAQTLYVVSMRDRVDGAIAGHEGCAYVNPPTLATARGAGRVPTRHR